MLESIYFSDLIETMLKRNPGALGYVLYRLEDEQIFAGSKGDDQFNPQMDFHSFFSHFPKSYSFPFIGLKEGIFKDQASSNIYVISPIMDLDHIDKNDVLGYFMMILDNASIFHTFHEDPTLDYRLDLKKQNWTMLDSSLSDRMDEQEQTGFLVHQAKTPDYNDYQFQVTGYKNKNAIRARLNTVTFVSILILGTVWCISLISIYLIQKIVVTRIHKLTRHFKKVQTDPFTGPVEVGGKDEISDLAARFNQMTAELQKYIDKVYIADIQKRNAEYYALKMQINPHFLYNTLESLRMYAIARQQPFLSNKLYSLGRLYRWLLKSDNDLIPIEEEITHTEYYLELLMLGKSNPIELRVDSKLDVAEYKVLKFILQPIIENAIIHGKLENVENPFIRLTIYRQDHLVIEIYNNGLRLSEDEQASLQKKLQTSEHFHNDHLGLKNIHERIKSYFGHDYGLQVEPVFSENGFCVSLRLPAVKTKRQVQSR
ncbi:sensor histidine kinase [Paenibacillus piri]|nr:histidine kinase [Paenibacillus piri]